MGIFKLKSDYEPAGDQPRVIEELVNNLKRGVKYQVLLGVTGSGKTFTIANVIARIDKPVLVISHNKTLAAQLYNEFSAFFPENAVEYFISYYDYYQPEAYIPRTDTYIAKDSSINDEIDRLKQKNRNEPFDPQGCDCRGERFLYIRSGREGGLFEACILYQCG